MKESFTLPVDAKGAPLGDETGLLAAGYTRSTGEGDDLEVLRLDPDGVDTGARRRIVANPAFVQQWRYVACAPLPVSLSDVDDPDGVPRVWRAYAARGG